MVEAAYLRWLGEPQPHRRSSRQVFPRSRPGARSRACLFSAINRSRVSRGVLPSILVMEATENRFGCYSGACGQAAADDADRWLSLDVIRNAWAEGLMRAPGIGMSDPLAKSSSQVPFVQRHDIVQAFATNASDQSFAMSIRSRRAHWRSQYLDFPTFDFFI